jgi:hypothetical protein
MLRLFALFFVLKLTGRLKKLPSLGPSRDEMLRSLPTRAERAQAED